MYSIWIFNIAFVKRNCCLYCLLLASFQLLFDFVTKKRKGNCYVILIIFISFFPENIYHQEKSIRSFTRLLLLKISSIVIVIVIVLAIMNHYLHQYLATAGSFVIDDLRKSPTINYYYCTTTRLLFLFCSVNLSSSLVFFVLFCFLIATDDLFVVSAAALLLMCCYYLYYCDYCFPLLCTVSNNSNRIVPYHELLLHVQVFFRCFLCSAGPSSVHTWIKNLTKK